MYQVKLNARLSDRAMEGVVGKIINDDYISLLICDTCEVYLPGGARLLTYVRGAISKSISDEAYSVATTIRAKTDNRQLASGSESYYDRGQRRSKSVMSSIIGNMDAAGRHQYCRQTAWTANHVEESAIMVAYAEDVARAYNMYSPVNYRKQLSAITGVDPYWIIGRTPFSTVTVNNTYPTGTHVDKGDYPGVDSCLSVMRRGSYRGGHLSFPRYRIAVDLRDTDLIMMNAHEWHGNTPIVSESGDAERISIVHYLRTGIIKCGTREDEAAKSVRRTSIPMGVE